MAMRWRNYTDIPDATAKAVYAAVCPAGLRAHVYGSRGRMSERDADAYGLQMLRRYRRGELQ